MTHLPNATVHDERLSYAALGLLAVIVARPENAPQGYRALSGRGLGEKAALTALRELTDAGYRHQVRRTGARGRLVTDTVISDEPITAEEAEEWLMGDRLDRAATVAARSDQEKQGVSAGRTVQCPTVARSTVARSGTAQVLRTSKVTTSLRSESPRDPNAREWCTDHDMPGGLTPSGEPSCPICRHFPARSPVPKFDHAQRAAGAHLESA